MKLSFLNIQFFLILTLISSGPVKAQELLSQPFSQEKLAQEIDSRLDRVDEFATIRKIAQQMGVRAYLFGGTAAAFAHYVKWDLHRESGDRRFQEGRFDYDYTSIFRSNQDMDIVIDGTPEQAARLESDLASKFPFFQGNKSVWEVRLLKDQRGDKESLLDNPDFLNQHTDSNSTGMIELTDPDPDHHPIRDLRDWENTRDPIFLKDVYNNQLHYYFHPLHSTTSRYKSGLNPPILSVIRYLTKAFQYELAIEEDSKEVLRKIIASFDYKKDTNNPYVKNWLEKNGKKLLQNAVNIEYAWNTLEELGLRKKLMEGSSKEMGSLYWWMNKEPLRSHPLGQGKGKTARQLGITEVAHETNNFDAYDSITRAPTGMPNVFISRQGVEGEMALHGNGFYTAKGSVGMKRTGITIRFNLHPDSREGSDFKEVGSGIILVLNRKALTVIPESLNWTMPQYFEKLQQGFKFDSNDRAVEEKIKRKMRNKSTSMTEEEEKRIVDIVLTSISGQLFDRHASTFHNIPILREWFQLPVSKNHPEVVEKLLERGSADKVLINSILGESPWNQNPHYIQKILDRKTVDFDVALLVLKKPRWKDHPQWVETLIQRGSVDEGLAEHVFTQPHWQDHPEWVEKFIREGRALNVIIRNVIGRPHWEKYKNDWVEMLIENGKADPALFYVVRQPPWNERPEILEKLLKRGKADKEFVGMLFVYNDGMWKKRMDWFMEILDRGNADIEISRYLYPQDPFKDRPDIVERLILRDNEEVDNHLHFLLQMSHWKEYFGKFLGRFSFYTVENIRKALKRKLDAESKAQGANCPQTNEWRNPFASFFHLQEYLGK